MNMKWNPGWLGLLAMVFLLLGPTACMMEGSDYGGEPYYSQDESSNYGDAGYSPGSDASSSAPDAGAYYSEQEEFTEEQGEVDAGVPDAGEEWAWFQLSPDDSTSMASAQILKSDSMFHGFPLLPHEVINYYDPPAQLREAGDIPKSWTTQEEMFIAIDAERIVATEDGAPERLELMVHTFAPQVPALDRKPWILHLCVDVSGSMSGDKIHFVRDALLRLADAMQAGDKISLATFETQGHVIFETLDFIANEPQIRAALASIEADGSTNMISGLELAYAEAQTAYDPGAVNRVLVFSDGQANVGDTDIETFAALTRINNQEGIYLSGIGVGADYATERMDALTDAGKGAHVFLPNADEVGVIFGEMVRKIVEVAADEVSIEVQLPAAFAIESFSGEEVSTNPQARVPNVVLAAGDDMTILAGFETEDAAAFDGEMILTVRYRPLTTAAQVVFEQRFPIVELLRAPSALMQRTRLVDAYGRWACGQDDDVDTAALRAQIDQQAPNDPGLSEVSAQIERISAP